MDVDRSTVGGVGRGSSGRWLWQWLGGASPYDRAGTPHYAGFNACSEFFRSHGLLDWTTLIFEWQLKTNISTGRLYDDFILLVFLHDHREVSVLTNELPEESDQFRFLRTACFANLKGPVGLIMTKTSDIRSSRSLIPLPRFIRSRRTTPLLAPSLVLFPPSSD